MKKTAALAGCILTLCSCASSTTQGTGSAPAPDASGITMAAIAPADLQTRQKYVETHRELSEDIKTAILQQKPASSMTPEQLRLVWGSPATVRKMTGISGAREEWNYPDGRQALFQLGLLYEFK